MAAMLEKEHPWEGEVIFLALGGHMRQDITAYSKREIQIHGKPHL